MTKYPNAKDDFDYFDPPGGDEENSGLWWNDLMDAIETIQGVTGAGCNGSLSDIGTRIGKQIAADGTLEEMDFGTVTGTPTVASPVTITFSKTFSSAPYVFVCAEVANTGGGIAAGDGIICAVQSVTTTTAQLVTRTKSGGTPSNSLTYHYWAIDGSVIQSLS